MTYLEHAFRHVIDVFIQYNKKYNLGCSVDYVNNQLTIQVYLDSKQVSTVSLTNISPQNATAILELYLNGISVGINLRK